MLGTAIRCSIQYCIIASRLADPRVLSRPVYPARGHGPKLNCDKPRTSWTVASLRPRNRYTQAKCQCMASQRQSGQPNTSELLAILNFINDSTKWVVTLTAGGVLAWHHDIYVSWCLVGSVVAVFVCKALKKAINIQRPAYARKQDPGMPSSHASSLAYLAVYLAVAWQPAQSALASSGLVLAALLIPLRVILGYHTVPQVLVGTGLGAASAGIWQALGKHAVLPVLQTNEACRQLLAAATVAALVCYAVAVLRSK